MKTCFVVIGYGEKDDYRTGRKLNLEKSYKNIIEPVFDELGINCFRALDRNYENSGFIDVKMYDYLLKADLVLADISTLNPNAIYELGIRHALRPYSTIIISEEGTEIPFDFGRNVIAFYRHLGEDIGCSEAGRFKEVLKKKVEAVLSKAETDSPVYTLFPNLVPPKFTEEEIEHLIESEEKREESERSLTELIDFAEEAKKNNQLEFSLQLFQRAASIQPNDLFLKQRVILLTYRLEKPNKFEALTAALELLKEIDYQNSHSIETRGLSGAVFKRLFETSGELRYLNQSIRQYKKGFCLADDYYNGINLAYLFTLRSSLESTSNEDAVVDFTLGNRIREEVSEICRGLISEEDFFERPENDQQWIYLTLAECYFGRNMLKEEQDVLDEFDQVFNEPFAHKSYQEQRTKLSNYITAYDQRKSNDSEAMASHNN